jgi:hypothetical protein
MSAAIQGIERRQDLAGLAPKRRFEPVEYEVWQIGEPQKVAPG